MNVFVQELARRSIPTPRRNRIVAEDNVGESVHIHVRETRLEMPIADFLAFAEGVERARGALEDGDS
jgi:hypothetical protein